MNYLDDDREKPDWKEIDKKKDRSRHVKEEPSERGERPQKTTYAHLQYKKRLEEFFSLGKKKEDKVKKDELKKIKEIKNRNQYMKAASEYVDKNGYPNDLDFLLSMLDHKEVPRVEDSLKKIIELYAEESDTRKDMIRQKVHILEMTSDNSKIQGLAEEALTQMK